MSDVEKQDLIGHLKDDLDKAMLLGCDIVDNYLPLCGDPRKLPDKEQTKLMRDLLWQYHRYSLTMDMLMDQIIKIGEKVDQIQ